MSLYPLPYDVLSVIIGNLEVKDVAKCKRVSKHFHAAASDESVWTRLIRRDCPWVELRAGDRPELAYKKATDWRFQPDSADDLSSDYTVVGPPAAREYLVPCSGRVMRSGVHSWSITIKDNRRADGWFFVGVGVHRSSSDGRTYYPFGSVCLDTNTYVLGFDRIFYHSSHAGAKTVDPLYDESRDVRRIYEERRLSFNLVLDCDQHELHFFLGDLYLGRMSVPAEPLVAIVEVGRGVTASIHPPAEDYYSLVPMND